MSIEARSPNPVILTPEEFFSVKGDSRFLQPRLNPIFSLSETSSFERPQRLFAIDTLTKQEVETITRLKGQNSCPDGQKWNKNKQKCVPQKAVEATQVPPLPNYFQIPEEYLSRPLDPGTLIKALCGDKNECTNEQLNLRDKNRFPTVKEVKKSLQKFMYKIVLDIDSNRKIAFPIADKSGTEIATYSIDEKDIINFLEYVTRDEKEQAAYEQAQKEKNNSPSSKFRYSLKGLIGFLVPTSIGLLLLKRHLKEHNRLMALQPSGDPKRRLIQLQDGLEKEVLGKLKGLSSDSIIGEIRRACDSIEFDHRERHGQINDRDVEYLKRCLGILEERKYPNLERLKMALAKVNDLGIL